MYAARIRGILEKSKFMLTCAQIQILLHDDPQLFLHHPLMGQYHDPETAREIALKG